MEVSLVWGDRQVEPVLGAVVALHGGRGGRREREDSVVEGE